MYIKHILKVLNKAKNKRKTAYLSLYQIIKNQTSNNNYH